MTPLLAQVDRSLDERISDAVSPVTDRIVEIVCFEVSIAGTGVPLIVVWLIAASTVYFGFIHLRGFRQSLRIVRGTSHDDDEPSRTAQLSGQADEWRNPAYRLGPASALQPWGRSGDHTPLSHKRRL